MANRDDLTDQSKLLFGAGFVFGVGTTLCLLAVVLVIVTRTPAGTGGLGASQLLATVAGGVLFAAVVGVGLWYLAFDENRAQLSVDPEQFGIEREK
jgi:hypothetical protein